MCFKITLFDATLAQCQVVDWQSADIREFVTVCNEEEVKWQRDAMRSIIARSECRKCL